VVSSHALESLAQEMVGFLGLNYNLEVHSMSHRNLAPSYQVRGSRAPPKCQHPNQNNPKIEWSFPIGLFAISRAANRLFTVKGIVCCIMHGPQLRTFPIPG
jgi:hypothetical protein